MFTIKNALGSIGLFIIAQLMLISDQYTPIETASSPQIMTTSFITEWDINAGDVITIPLQSGTYNFEYTWTSNFDTIFFINGIHTNADGDFTTAFNFTSTYRLEITGQFPRMRNYPKDKLADVIQWGDIQWTSMEEMFRDWPGTGFTATDAPDLSSVGNMNGMFRNASNFNEDLDHWDVSNVNMMRFVFADASSFNGNISTWDVSKVTEMSFMFKGASVFNSDISGWVTNELKQLDRTFQSASVFNQNIGGWNVSKVTNIQSCFNSANAFNQDIGGWDVSNVVNMKFAFFNTSDFNQDIGAWNVSKVNNMESMFRSATEFNQDISEWDVSNVTNMRETFRSCTAFNQPIGNWDVSKVTTFREMFVGCTSFNQSLGNWKFKDDLTSGISLQNATSMDCQSWSSTIIGWNFNNPELSNINVTSPSFEYDTIAARSFDELVNERGWNFNGTVINDNCSGEYVFNCLDSVQFNVDTLFGQLTFLSSGLVGLDSIVLDSAGQYMITSPEFELGPGFEIKLGAEFETSSESGCP